MTGRGWRASTILPLVCGMILLPLLLLAGRVYPIDSDALTTLIFFELILVAVWCYRRRFFSLLLAAFLGAGIRFPFNMALRTGRWCVLGVATAVGIILYMRDRQLHLTSFHALSFACATAALVSAVVSAFPQVAVLKALSLLLLFLYCATGARLAVQEYEWRFLAGCIIGCEWLVYAAAISYFLFNYPILGNPNSLGAVMGVVTVPMLLWGILISDSPQRRFRYAPALIIALILLFASYARAGIAAAVCSCLLICIVSGRYRLLVKGICLSAVLAAMVVALVPKYSEPSGSWTSIYLYKGKREQGILGSRKSVWDNTVAVIREHPWLGSGFGTSNTSDEDDSQQMATVQSTEQATREHGNSYLAITEWVGLLGDVPFLLLLLAVVLNIVRVLGWVGRSRSVCSPAVPVAMVVTGGLVHAAFEDWLFAVGYYLCVFFWVFAFVLVDLVAWSKPSLAAVPAATHTWPGRPPVLIPVSHAPVS